MATPGRRPTYRERRLAKAERLRGWAESREAEAKAAGTSARAIADMVPPGQPILTGHHSEARHRRDVGRMTGGVDWGAEHSAKARDMRSRADGIEAAAERAIHSDDPDAVERLRELIQRIRAGPPLGALAFDVIVWVCSRRRERGEPGARHVPFTPAAFDPDRIAARHVDGVLEIAIPTPEEAKPRRVQIASGATRGRPRSTPTRRRTSVRSSAAAPSVTSAKTQGSRPLPARSGAT